MVVTELVEEVVVPSAPAAAAQAAEVTAVVSEGFVSSVGASTEQVMDSPMVALQSQSDSRHSLCPLAPEFVSVVEALLAAHITKTEPTTYLSKNFLCFLIDRP